MRWRKGFRKGPLVAGAALCAGSLSMPISTASVVAWLAGVGLIGFAWGLGSKDGR